MVYLHRIFSRIAIRSLMNVNVKDLTTTPKPQNHE